MRRCRARLPARVGVTRSPASPRGLLDDAAAAQRHGQCGRRRRARLRWPPLRRRPRPGRARSPRPSVAAVAAARDGRAGRAEPDRRQGQPLVAAALVARGAGRARTHGFPEHPTSWWPPRSRACSASARGADARHARSRVDVPGGSAPPCRRRRDAVRVRERRPPRPSASSGSRGRARRRAAARRLRREAGRRGPRAGCAAPCARQRAARAAELLRRLTTGHLVLLRRGPGGRLRRSAHPLDGPARRGPMQALDDFYLVNRAAGGRRPPGRRTCCASARPAAVRRPRSPAARAVPLTDRVSGALSAAVLAELSPALADIPLAGKPRAGPPFTGAASTATRSRRSCAATSSTWASPAACSTWSAGGRGETAHPAAHGPRLGLGAGHAACLVSGDYRKARETTPQLPVA